MDGHGRCDDVCDDGVTARAASCHSCLRRKHLSVCAMMARRGAGALPVPHASLDLSNRAQLSPTPWPRLANDMRLLSTSRGGPSHALAWLPRFLVLSLSPWDVPGRRPRAAPCPVCPVPRVMSVRHSPLPGSACSPLGCLRQKVNLSTVRLFLP
jgi:hypothetical protein